MRLNILMAFLFGGAVALSAAVLPPGFIELPLATGLDPTAMAQTPDGRILITEKYGAVRVVENDVLLPDPMILLQVSNYNERGLSGIALHPDFAQNGWLYLYYTVKNGGRNRLSRFQVLGNYADPLSELVLLETDPLAGTIHNGGAMVFGADDKLYLAIGDGAYSANAPNPESLLGKVLRLNDDGSIPDDNPYYQQNTGIFRAIYASGFRNPFSMAVQPGTGKIFVCDVGSEFWEEINHVQAGKDYGWNLLEGKRSWQTTPDNYLDPVYTYSHAVGCAIVGAAFYNPPLAQFPQTYQGKFFYADYCKNHIKMFNPATGIASGTFASQIDRPLAILTGNNGSLYYLSRGGMGGGSEVDNTSSQDGMLWKVSYVGNGAPVFSVPPANLLVVAGEDANFHVQCNGSAPITYSWERDGVVVPGAAGPELSIPNTMLSDSGTVIRCKAVNGFGQVYSAAAVLKVTANQRPMPMITTPSDQFRYSAGEPVTFAGFATDPETGTLSADDLTWRIDLHHDDHTHPGMAATPGIETGTFTLPVIGETAENVWVRILLSARDQAGLSRTVYKDIYPQLSRLQIQSDPPGIPVRVDGKTSATPFETASVRGLRRLVEAPRLHEQGPELWVFERWDDGDLSPVKSLFPQDSIMALRAVYTPASTGKGSGLRGVYYEGDNEGVFGAEILARTDTTINFDWMLGSPDPAIPDDNFTVRWEGFIEPLFTANYSFIVGSDDGCRLWIGDQQIIDAWFPKGAYEVYSSNIQLEKGRRYPIRLEYFEIGGEAVAKLLWATTLMPKTIIPKSQLYPRLPEYYVGDDARGTIHIAPNPVSGTQIRLFLDFSHAEQLLWRIVDEQGRIVRDWDKLQVETTNQDVYLPIEDLGNGLYWLQAKGSFWMPAQVIPFVKAN